MKKILASFFMLAILLSAVGCSSYKPVCATSNPVGSKTGEASVVYILGLIPVGEDNTISNAAKNGKISKISTVDFKWTYYFVAIGHKTIVTGE